MIMRNWTVMIMMMTGTMITWTASGFDKKSVREVDTRAGALAAGKSFIYGNHNVPI